MSKLDAVVDAVQAALGDPVAAVRKALAEFAAKDQFNHDDVETR